jgi:hypothetical protein
MRISGCLRAVGWALWLGVVLLVSSPARAALTDSEKAQIKGFVQQTQLSTVERVRALIARPDLSLEESTSALADAIVPVLFTDSSALYLRDLVFGGPSLTGRPVLVSVVTRALLARADSLLAKYAADADQHPAALAELLRIYTFLDAQIANAGHPGPLPQHDPQAGIPASTYADCVRALSEHVQKNPRWLVPQAPVSLAFARVRAAEEVLLYEMLPDSPTLRVDAATALGLAGARKKLFTELGVLALDSGASDDARVEHLRAWLKRVLPSLGPRANIEAIVFGDARPPLRARGNIVGVAVPLELLASQTPLAPSEEADTVPVDLPFFVLAYELAEPVASSVLREHAELRRWTEADVQASEAPRGAMTTEDRVAGMMAQLLVDAPRTMDLAFARFIGGRARTAGLLSDALGVFVAIADATGATHGGVTVGLGHPVDAAGGTDRLVATGVGLSSTGAATSFTLAPHRWEIQRETGGEVVGVRCDGKPVTLAELRSARVPVTEALSWTTGGLVFARLSGAPRAGVAPGSRIRLVGVGASDAIATPSPGDDAVIEADLSVSGGEGGLVARAVSTKTSFQGVSLVLLPGSTPSAPAHAALRVEDGAGGDANLGQAVELPTSAGTPTHVKLSVKGTAVEAAVGPASLKGVLPASLAHGDVAVRANQGATVEVAGLTLHRR